MPEKGQFWEWIFTVILHLRSCIAFIWNIPLPLQVIFNFTWWYYQLWPWITWLNNYITNFRLGSSNIPTDYHPHLISIIYLFPILCSTSRLVDNQHHLHDIIIGKFAGFVLELINDPLGGVLGLIGGNFIYSTMMPEAESNKSSEILKSSKKKSSKNSTSQEELVVNDDVTFLPK